MKSDQCEKCQDRTATVYLTLIGPSDEVDTHRYCDPCYGLLQEEAANTPVENTAPAVTSSAVTNGIIAAEKPNSAADAAEASQQGPSTQCNRCSTVVLNEDLDKNFRVCPHCQFHFRIGASDRIHLLTAPGSFEELDADMMSAEVL